jgi:RNA-binding protein YhbY
MPEGMEVRIWIGENGVVNTTWKGMNPLMARELIKASLTSVEKQIIDTAQAGPALIDTPNNGIEVVR